MSEVTPKSIKWRTSDFVGLAICVIPAAIFTWGIHEYAHWLMGTILGHEMWITFNQVGPVEGGYERNMDAILIAMAGPVVTWLQAIIALWIVLVCRELWAFSFLFLAFWMRALAMFISYVGKLNDEARASLDLGLPMWLLPLVSVTLLFCLTVWGDRKIRPGWLGYLVCFVMSSFMTTSIIFADQYVFSN